MTPIRLGLVGVGKIAVDQHLPALAADPRYELVAVVSRHSTPQGLDTFSTIEAMLAAHPQIEALSLCTPPVGRYALARQAIAAGRHLMLEKPPGATVSEVESLTRLAADAGISLYATWHSREAAAVAPARAWLADKRITGGAIRWKEDVRRWHPGQAWIWEPGGLGVFDPGINALSILTAILPQPVVLEQADLSFPANRAAPIAAALTFRTPDEAAITADFDWRQTGMQIWEMEIETDAGRLALTDGGSKLFIDGEALITADKALSGEYPNLYARFHDLVRHGKSDVDLSPFRHVADAFMLGRRSSVEAFED